MGEGMKNLTYIGWNEILETYDVKVMDEGLPIYHRFKTKADADRFIDNYTGGGVEEFRG